MKKKVIDIILLLLIFDFGLFFRIYRINEFATFLGDQGRDAIIVKRIISFEHLPAIGAPMSIATNVGNLYLGPFYYYLLTPFQFILRNNPLSQALAVAMINSFSILAVFFMVKKFFGRAAALLTAFLIAFSQINISLSRFSWNPNTLPFFSFISLYFFLMIIKKKKRLDYILFGLSLALSLQLHYMYLPLIAVYILIIGYLCVKKVFHLDDIKKFVYSFASFLLISSPLLVFDLRHEYLNLRALISLFVDRKDVIGLSQPTSYLNNLFTTLQSFIKFTFNLQIKGLALALAVIIFALGFYFVLKDKKAFYERIVIYSFSLFFLVIIFYHGEKNPHYFTPIFYIFFLVLSIVLLKIKNNLAIFGKIFLVIFSLGYLYLNISNLDFIMYKPSNQIAKTQAVAKIIFDNITENKYTLTTLPYKYSDSTYRYFLEIWGKKPLEKDSLERADELFVVCEAPCQPIGDPQWDIAYFAPKKIEGVWHINDLTIYRLSH